MDKIYRKHSESPRMQELRFKHMDHMTGEDLHGKAEIAEELAVRDKHIEELEKDLMLAREALEIIAGYRLCFDNTLSNVEIAEQALAEYDGEYDE